MLHERWKGEIGRRAIGTSGFAAEALIRGCARGSGYEDAGFAAG